MKKNYTALNQCKVRTVRAMQTLERTLVPESSSQGVLVDEKAASDLSRRSAEMKVRLS